MAALPSPHFSPTFENESGLSCAPLPLPPSPTTPHPSSPGHIPHSHTSPLHPPPPHSHSSHNPLFTNSNYPPSSSPLTSTSVPALASRRSSPLTINISHKLSRDGVVPTLRIIKKKEAFDEKEVSKWSVADVCGWLESGHMGEYANEFRRNLIDGDVLLDLDTHDLRVLKVQESHIATLLHMIQELKEVPFEQSNVDKWGNDDVSQWLASIGKERYIPLFRDECFDGETLQEMRKVDFVKIGVLDEDAEFLVKKLKQISARPIASRATTSSPFSIVDRRVSLGSLSSRSQPVDMRPNGAFSLSLTHSLSRTHIQAHKHTAVQSLTFPRQAQFLPSDHPK